MSASPSVESHSLELVHHNYLEEMMEVCRPFYAFRGQESAFVRLSPRLEDGLSTGETNSQGSLSTDTIIRVSPSFDDWRRKQLAVIPHILDVDTGPLAGSKVTGGNSDLSQRLIAHKTIPYRCFECK